MERPRTTYMWQLHWCACCLYVGPLRLYKLEHVKRCTNQRIQQKTIILSVLLASHIFGEDKKKDLKIPTIFLQTANKRNSSLIYHGHIRVGEKQKVVKLTLKTWGMVRNNERMNVLSFTCTAVRVYPMPFRNVLQKKGPQPLALLRKIE